MAEYESWVPMVKNAMHDVPRPLGWALAAILLLASCFCLQTAYQTRSTKLGSAAS